MADLDAAGPVRAGEELDLAALGAFLSRELGLDGPLEVAQFPSGFSNLTYLLRLGGRELVLRRPPVGSKVKGAHDMLREHSVLSRLHAVYELAPRPLAACADPGVLGAPFYVMERVPGVVLRGRGRGELAPEVDGRLAAALASNLARLHAIDWRAAGLADLGRPEGYTGRQVRGWAERYRGSQTDDLPEIEAVAGWLLENVPAESAAIPAAVVHNDYKHDNLVLDPDDLSRIRAVLDWEMATLGDPLLDLGTTLGYWVEADDPPELRQLAFGPTAVPGSPTRAELISLYAAAAGRDLAGMHASPSGSPLAFYYAFGLFKIAVIAQQIYFRWKQGLTRDPRFGHLLGAIRVLGHQAALTIETGKI